MVVAKEPHPIDNRLAVGFALAGLTLAEIRGLRANMREHRAEILARLDAMEQCIIGRLVAMRRDFNGRMDTPLPDSVRLAHEEIDRGEMIEQSR